MDTLVPWKRRVTLLACFLHFDLSFMLWVLLGALGIHVAEAAHLSPAQKGLVVAVPILTGSLLRVPVGVIADRVGGKRVGIAMLAFLFVPLMLGWQLRATFPSLLLLGATLGTAGASFAVALPLASKWFPPERQGLALGIAAAGNSGTVVTNLVAPRLAKSIGWNLTFACAMLPLALVLVLFIVLAHEPPRAPGPKKALFPSLKNPDLWWLCFFYSITFGGYVGLGSFSPLLLRDQFGVSPLTAGYATAALAFAGSASRPLGGILADRVGGTRLLSALLFLIAVLYALVSRLPSFGTTVALLGILMVCLGLGNGALFQLVPLRFQKNMGAVTGIVGAIGGVGGFLLPTILGNARQYTGTFAAGLIGLALVAAVAAVCLRVLLSPRGSWRRASVATEGAAE